MLNSIKQLSDCSYNYTELIFLLIKYIENEQI
jgi:hypothetical protein